MIVFTLLIGCGGQAAHGPSASTRRSIAHAETLESERRHDEALAAYEQAIRDAPDRPSELYARLELASQLAFWHDLGGAIAQLEAVVALDDKLARAWHDLGVLRHAQHDDAGARTALERAVALAPDDARPRIALAALLWDTGDLAAARAQYEALLELELPDNVRDKVEWAIAQLSETPRE